MGGSEAAAGLTDQRSSDLIMWQQMPSSVSYNVCRWKTEMADNEEQKEGVA